ncbi:MAG: hypothetical protein V5A23_04995 [Halobacteriales archaeon]
MPEGSDDGHERDRAERSEGVDEPLPADDDDPLADLAAGGGEDGESSGNRDEREESEPLGDLTGRVNRRRGANEPDDELFERAFEDVSRDETDPEEVWDRLADGESTVGLGESATETEREEYVVDKRTYCLNCQFFSAPPETRCTYDGSEILELEDSGHFRVRGCPVVEGEEDLRERG